MKHSMENLNYTKWEMWDCSEYSFDLNFDEDELSFGVIVCYNLIIIIFFLDYYYVQGQINISLQIWLLRSKYAF